MSATRWAIFLSVALSITAGIHYYLWIRLVRAPSWPTPWFRLGTASLLAFAIAIPAAMIASRSLPRWAASGVSWVVFSWMGVMFFLLVLTLSVDMVMGAVHLVRRMGQSAPDPERRRFLARVLGGAVVASAFGLSAVAAASALGRVRVKRVTVPLRRMSRALSGFTLVQMTDIHVGPTIGRKFIEELVASCNALKPDVIAITGDLVDGFVEDLGPAVAPLRNLRAKYGVFFVTGNHEYYSGADEWIAFLTSLGVKVLRNERVAVEHNGESIDIAGVDDATAHEFGHGHGADLPKALEGRDVERPVVLLAHQPKAIGAAAQAGVDLQISGHTHGGQLFPFNFLVKLQQPYVSGLHRHENTMIYVSNGTGYWGPPMRLGAPAEITRIELTHV